MSNTKTTKRALFSSIMAMLLCVAMLIGTTFAWFTDSVTSAGNKIQAGTLNIDLLVKSDGEYASVKDSSAAIFDYDKWEPGYTEVKNVMVKTDGNLALKYTLKIVPQTATEEAFKLAEVIDVYYANSEVTVENRDLSGLTRIGTLKDVFTAGTVINDTLIPDSNTEDFATIVLKMQESAGNDYQGLSVGNGFDLHVLATQYTYEEDSFDDQYDADAEYPVVAADETTLRNALEAGKDVRLGSDIALTAPITINGDVEVIGDGNSVISSKEVYIAPTANVNFKNVNFANPVWSNNKASSVYASGFEGKVVFDGCTFTNPQWECIQITPKDGAEVIVTNCTFVVDGNGTYAQAGGTKVERMLHIQNTAASGKYTAVITNNAFIGVDLCRNAVIDVDDIEAFANVTCGENTFANHDNTPVATLDDGMIYVNINGRYDAANVATDTYAQFTQTPAAALHH